MSRTWVAGAVGLFAVALVAAAIVAARFEPRELEEASIEDPSVAEPMRVAAAFERARQRLVGVAPGPSALLAADPHGTLWVCAYDPPSVARCAGAGEADAAAGIDRAVEALRALGTSPRSKLKIDWPLTRVRGMWPRDASRHGAGVEGIAVGDGVILPSEVLERDLFTSADEDEPLAWDVGAVRALLSSRGEDVGETFAYDRLYTASWVEGADGRPVRLYRTHAWELPALDPPDVERRARMAAEALANAVQPDGRITYEWDVSAGAEKRGSNLLRHGGSTFALIQAFERFGDPRYREAAGRALTFLLGETQVDERTGPYGGGPSRHVVEGTHVKLGGAALALLALARWQIATGDPQFSPAARELATYLVAMQHRDGEFEYFAPREVGGEPRADTSAYYPGEAVFALGTWYAVDPDPLWLDTARRGADWLIDVRDAGKDETELDADHWLSYGLGPLYAATADPRYVEHALRIGAAIEAQSERQRGHERNHRDYLGGFYEPPRSTPASTRAEALVGILDLCRAARRDCAPFERRLEVTLRHAVQLQYTEDLLYWVPRPERVAGAIGGGLVHPDTRNDFTQHALSALLGLERLRSVDTARPPL
ncbi:MAG: hypothetical protein ABMA64_11515 [Myxococcota bacterium]